PAAAAIWLWEAVPPLRSAAMQAVCEALRTGEDDRLAGCSRDPITCPSNAPCSIRSAPRKHPRQMGNDHRGPPRRRREFLEIKPQGIRPARRLDLRSFPRCVACKPHVEDPLSPLAPEWRAR